MSLLPNILMKYGWNPNNVGEKFIGDLIAAKMGDPDITFKQVSLLHTSSLVLAFSSICFFKEWSL